MTTPTPFLPNTRFFPLEGEYLQRELNLFYNDCAGAINGKDIALYTKEATSTGQKFFAADGKSATRATMRKGFTFPSILNGTTSTPHGITVVPTTQFTRIYGTANRTSTRFFPLPYINVITPADSIQLSISATDVVLTTTTGNYTDCMAIVIIEYIPS
jgi:hypothetical protein